MYSWLQYILSNLSFIQIFYFFWQFSTQRTLFNNCLHSVYKLVMVVFWIRFLHVIYIWYCYLCVSMWQKHAIQGFVIGILITDPLCRIVSLRYIRDKATFIHSNLIVLYSHVRTCLKIPCKRKKDLRLKVNNDSMTIDDLSFNSNDNTLNFTSS